MLTPDELKKLNKINNLRPILDISMCWIVIATSLVLCHLSYYFIPVAMLIIATRLHALVIIMHDGAHHLINKNELMNDIISNVFCSFPLQLSTEAYRKTHYKHHQHTQTSKDPNYVIMQKEEAWHFPKSKSEVKKILIKDLLLMTIKDHLIILKDWQVLPNYKLIGKLEQVLFPIFLISLLTMATVFHLWMDLLILQAAALFINPIVRIRAMSEHIHHESQGQGKINKLHETPTINANWLEKFFISPCNTNRHLEHHVYPTIPYYNLEVAHRIISQTQLYKAHCAYELDGYFMGKRNAFTEVLASSEEIQIIKVA